MEPKNQTEQLHEGYYCVIPLKVLQDDRLSWSAKILYGEITALVGKEGFCYASNEFFASIFRFKDIRQVTKLVSKLQKTGYIKTEILEFNKRKIWLTEAVLGGVEQKFEGGRTKVLGGSNKSSTPMLYPNLYEEKEIYKEKEKQYPPLKEQMLKPEQIYRVSILKNVWCSDVIKLYYKIRDLIENDEFKAKWGKDLYRILLKWTELEVKRGSMLEMDEVRQELNKWNDPVKTITGQNLFKRFEQARKEGRI